MVGGQEDKHWRVLVMPEESYQEEKPERYTLCGDISQTESKAQVVIKDNKDKKLFTLTSQEAYIWYYLTKRKEVDNGSGKELGIVDVDQRILDEAIKKLSRLGLLRGEGVRLAGRITSDNRNIPERKAYEGGQESYGMVENRQRTEYRREADLVGKLDIWLIRLDRPQYVGAKLDRLIGNVVLGRTYRIVCLGLVTLGLATLWQNLGIFMYDVENAVAPNIITLVTVSLMVDVNRIVAKLAGAGAGWRYGQEIREAGYALYFGIIPSVLIKFSDRSMASKVRLRISSTCILTRCGWAGILMVGWFIIREQQNDLSRLLTLGTMTSLGGLLLEANPLWPSDGYETITAWAGVGDMYKQGFQLVGLGRRVKGIDEAMTSQQRRRLYIGTIIGMMAVGVIVLFSVALLGSGLATAVGNEILGNSAQTVVITALIVGLGWRIFRVTKGAAVGRNTTDGTSLLR